MKHYNDRPLSADISVMVLKPGTTTSLVEQRIPHVRYVFKDTGDCLWKTVKDSTSIFPYGDMIHEETVNEFIKYLSENCNEFNFWQYKDHTLFFFNMDDEVLTQIFFENVFERFGEEF